MIAIPVTFVSLNYLLSNCSLGGAIRRSKASVVANDKVGCAIACSPLVRTIKPSVGNFYDL